MGFVGGAVGYGIRLWGLRVMQSRLSQVAVELWGNFDFLQGFVGCAKGGMVESLVGS